MDNIRLNKANRYAVALARFAEECGITVRDAATLATLADRAFHAGERACSIDVDAFQLDVDKTHDHFNAAAIRCGLEPIWPGLWPMIRKNGRDIEIPSE